MLPRTAIMQTCNKKADIQGLWRSSHTAARSWVFASRHHRLHQLPHGRAVACTAVPPCSSKLLQPLQPGISSSSHMVTRVQRVTSVRRLALPPLAMVNVDFASPSLVLGVTLIGCGIALLQVRNMQREVSRDADIVVAAMISIVGSTLIFQGWRLDPLLLLCQALTTSVAFWYGLEAFKLRAEVVQDEEQDGNLPGQQLPPLPEQMPMGQQPDFSAAVRPGYLPPGSEQTAPWAQQQQQAGPFPTSSGARWGLPPAGQQSAPYDMYAAGGAVNSSVADSTYAGLGQEAGSNSIMQQQYMADGYGLNGGYGNEMYGAAAGAEPYMQQQGGPVQQPQQYEWPQGSYGQQPLPPPYGQQQQQQQPVWYDAAGVPVGAGAPGEQPQQQGPYSSLPGLIDPDLQGAGPSGTPAPLTDGQLLSGGYISDGSLGLPPPAEQQQQQQQQRRSERGSGQQVRPQGSGRSGYEQVDDWE